jgi:fibronectin-binding autotransporter adhesin
MHSFVTSSWRCKALAVAAIAIVAGLSQAGYAATYIWIGTGNTPENPWTDPNQWDPNTPGPVFADDGTNPGDDLTFGASAVTTVNIRPDVGTTGADKEDKVNSLMFLVGAPAYTFVSANSAHDIDLFGPMTNNSGVIQTFASGIAFDGAACIVNGATGDAATNYAFECGDHVWLGGSPTYNGPFDVHVAGTGGGALQSISVILNDAKIVVEGGTNAAGTYLVDGNGTIIVNGPWGPSSSTSAITKQGTGTLILNGASSATGRPLTIANGIVRLRDSSALGNTTRIITVNGNTGGLGTLQLDNNITLSKKITIGGKQQGSGTIPAIENLSGDNAVTGNITITTGGGQYNFSSLSGKLTINGNIVAGSSVAGSRFVNFRGPGAGEFAGSVGSDNSTSGSLPIIHRGTGTLTLSGVDNWRLGHIMCTGGGTLKFASTFGNTETDQVQYPLFAPVDDSTPPIPVRFYVEGASKLDFTETTTTGGSNIGLPGGGLALDRPVTGTGTIVGNVVASAGAEIWPGEVIVYGAPPSESEWYSFGPGTGTLTFQNDLDLSAGGTVLKYDLTNNPAGVNDKVVVGGTLTVGAITTIEVNQINGFLGSGTYHLMEYVGPALDTGNFELTGVTLTPRQTSATLVASDGHLDLVVVGDPATLTWVGGVSSNLWDVGGTVNWTGAPGITPDNHFFDGDSVVFDDSGSNSPAVTVAGPVSPSAMSFSQSAGHDYTIAGGDVVVFNDATMSGSGGLTLANTAFSVNNMTLSGSGALTFANTDVAAGSLTNDGGATVTLANTGTVSAGSIALNTGTLALDRADDFEIGAAISGAGTLQKDNVGAATISGNNAGFTGPIVVAAGTLKAIGNTTLGAGGSMASGVTVMDGATLDAVNGTTTPGTGTEVVTIAGSGVNDVGALVVATATNSNAHINQVILNGDARIGAYGTGSTSAGRSILWIDGPGAAFQGNGHNLSVVVSGNAGNGTEIDFLDVGNINVNDMEISGGNACYLGDDTTIGPAAGTLTLNGGHLGLYGTLSGDPWTGTVDKSIVGVSGGIDTWDGDATITSPINLTGGLELTVWARTNSSTSTLMLTGKLTGAGGLTIHCNSNGSSRLGLVELTGDNDYTGWTTIGGGGGWSNVGAGSDRITVLVNGTHSANSFYTVAGGTLGGTGQINSTVDLSGTLAPGGLDSPGTLALGALQVEDGATLRVRLRAPGSTDDDEAVVAGSLSFPGTAATTLNVDVTALDDQTTLPDGDYLLVEYGTLDPLAHELTLNYTGPLAGGQAASLSFDQDNNRLYLHLGAPVPQKLADIDGNGTVDAVDLGLLQACLLGPTVPIAVDCDASDLDSDNDVDQDDFGLWQNCYSGAGQQAEIPRCTTHQVQ